MTTEVFVIPPKTEFSEIFEWGTSVISCRASENAKGWREYPRYQLEYSFVFRNLKEARYARALAERISSNLCYMPLWMFYSIFNSLSAGSTTIVADFTHMDIPTIEQKFLLYESIDNWEIVTTATPTVGLYTLATPLANSYTKAWLIPLLEGYIPEGLQFSDKSGGDYSATLKFLGFYILTSVELPPSINYFGGIPVLDLPVQLSRSIEHRVSKAATIVDSDIGLFESIAVEVYNRKSTSLTVSAKSYASMEVLRNTLKSLRGREMTFWLPSKFKDLQLLTNSIPAGASYISVAPTHLNIANRFLLVRTATAVYYLSLGTVTPIDSLTDHVEVLNPPTVDIFGVLSMEFMEYSRLAGDSLTLAHKAKKFFSCSFATVSLKHLPILTLPTYPPSGLRVSISADTPRFSAASTDYVFIQGNGHIYRISTVTLAIETIISGIPDLDTGNGVKWGGLFWDGTFLWSLLWVWGAGMGKYLPDGTLISTHNPIFSGMPYIFTGSSENLYIITTEGGLYRINFSGNILISSYADSFISVLNILFANDFLWLRTASTLSRLHPTTLEVLSETTITFIDHFHAGIAFDGIYLWISNGSQETVSKINASTGAVIATYIVGYAVSYITYLPTGYIAVSCQSFGVVFLNPLTGVIVSTLETYNPQQTIQDSHGKFYIPKGSTNLIEVY